MKFEEASRVKYLGTIVTKDNLIEEEIKERIATGNRAFFVNQKIFQSKLIAKKSKIKLYKALIRPVVVYRSESWVLTGAFFVNQKIFQSKLIAKKSKIKLYKALIRPVVVYGSESWVFNGKYQAEIIGIRKEGIEKNIWSNTEGRRRVEAQNR